MKKISKHIEYNIPIDLLIPPWFLVANNTYFLGLPDSNILAQSLRCFSYKMGRNGVMGPL